MNVLDQKIISPDESFSVVFHYLNTNPLTEAYYSVSLQNEDNSEKFKLAGVFTFSDNQVWSADSSFIVLDQIQNNLETETLTKKTRTFDVLSKRKLAK